MYFLQAFGDASKTVTNDSEHFTDELARWYLDNVPGVEIYFAIIPGRANVPDEIKSRPVRSGPTVIIPPEKEVPSIVKDFIKSVDEPVAEVIKPEVLLKKKVVATKRRK